MEKADLGKHCLHLHKPGFSKTTSHYNGCLHMMRNTRWTKQHPDASPWPFVLGELKTDCMSQSRQHVTCKTTDSENFFNDPQYIYTGICSPNYSATVGFHLKVLSNSHYTVVLIIFSTQSFHFNMKKYTPDKEKLRETSYETDIAMH